MDSNLNQYTVSDSTLKWLKRIAVNTVERIKIMKINGTVCMNWESLSHIVHETYFSEFNTIDQEPVDSNFTVRFVPSPSQRDGVSCGLFVIANMFLICKGIMNVFDETSPNAPSTFVFKGRKLREW